MAACGGRQLMTGGYKRERDIYSIPHYTPLCTSVHQCAPVCMHHYACTTMHHYAHYAPVCTLCTMHTGMHQYASANMHQYQTLCTSMH